MIFDNVEDMSLVRDCYPLSRHGSVLITTRRHDLVAMQPSMKHLEIVGFDQEQGGSLILYYLGRDKYTDDERQAAKELSLALGGIALAIIIMVSQIRLNEMTIRQFIPYYQKYAPRLQESATANLQPYYQHSLKTAWTMSFDSLSDDATKLFRVFSFTAPGGLPADFVRGEEDPTQMPGELEFCKDLWGYLIFASRHQDKLTSASFQQAMKSIIDTSLARKDPNNNLVYTHRVIQQGFRNTMRPEDRRETLKLVSKLLLNSFPRLINGISLRKHWPSCQTYIQHIIFLSELFDDFKLEPRHPREFEDLTICLASASW